MLSILFQQSDHKGTTRLRSAGRVSVKLEAFATADTQEKIQ